MIFRLIAAVAGREMASASLRTRRIQLSLKIQQLAHKVEVGRNVGLFSAHKVVRVVQTHRHFVHQISLAGKGKPKKKEKTKKRVRKHYFWTDPKRAVYLSTHHCDGDGAGNSGQAVD